MKKIISLALVAIMLMSAMFTFASCGKNGGVKVIDIPLSVEKYAFAVGKDDAELLAKVNE